MSHCAALRGLWGNCPFLMSLMTAEERRRVSVRWNAPSPQNALPSWELADDPLPWRSAQRPSPRPQCEAYGKDIASLAKKAMLDDRNNQSRISPAATPSVTGFVAFPSSSPRFLDLDYP